MTREVAKHHFSHDEVDGHLDGDAIDVFGFWIYILTDCVLFASLFAAYAVLHNNTFGQPGLRQLVNLPYVLAETLFLLASSFTYGLAMLDSTNFTDTSNEKKNCKNKHWVRIFP